MILKSPGASKGLCPEGPQIHTQSYADDLLRNRWEVNTGENAASAWLASGVEASFAMATSSVSWVSVMVCARFCWVAVGMLCSGYCAKWSGGVDASWCYGRK